MDKPTFDFVKDNLPFWYWDFSNIPYYENQVIQFHPFNHKDKAHEKTGVFLKSSKSIGIPETYYKYQIHFGDNLGVCVFYLKDSSRGFGIYGLSINENTALLHLDANYGNGQVFFDVKGYKQHPKYL